MNPIYTLHIDIVLGFHKEHKNRTLYRYTNLDFVPQEGMTLRFTSEDGDDELDVTLINLHYDMVAKQWVERQQDDTLCDELKELEHTELAVLPARADEYINWYKSFGWEVI